MHENTRRALVRYATRHGLVGGVPVFAVALALVTRFGELTPRSYCVFVGLGCLGIGVTPFLLADHVVLEEPAGARAVDVGTSGRRRYELGFAFLAAGVYAFAAFVALGHL